MKNNMMVKVGVAMIAAVVAGTFTPLGSNWLRVYSLIGQLFLNGLMLVVIPLVVASMIVGAARMGREGNMGGLGIGILSAFALIATCAVAIGAVMVNILQPGVGVSLAATQITLPPSGDFLDQISDISLRIIPGNLLATAANGQILGLIFFCLAFGYYAGKLPKAAIVVDFWTGVFKVMMAVTSLVMLALPFGVFGLVAKVVATTGLEILRPVSYFFLTVCVGLALLSFVIFPLLARVNPFRYFHSMAPALFTAFSTSSSAATLPLVIECVEERIGVPNRIAGVTLPIGASVSLAGSALYSCMGAFFIAQAYSVPITYDIFAIILLMSFLLSFGTGGVPSASLVALVVILQTSGIPTEGIALLMATERILDMLRTPVNVLGNATCAVMVAKAKGHPKILEAT